MHQYGKKIPVAIRLRSRQLWLLVLAGSVFRFLYGIHTQAWLGSPDQLAWGMEIEHALQQHAWSYLAFTHAPHEGGSFFISVLSVLFSLLPQWLPPLSWAALFIDTAGRFAELKVTRQFFGDETALWFGLWTVLSAPLFIPWATVNFGLHALLGCVPFVFCRAMVMRRHSKYFAVGMGLLCALAVSLSYNSIVLAIVAVCFVGMDAGTVDKRLKRVLFFLLSFSIAMLPHLATRLFLYPSESLLSVRALNLNGIAYLQNAGCLVTAWFTAIPGSFWLSGGFWYVPVSFFLLTGAILYLKKWKTPVSVKLLPVAVVVVFVTLYVFSPLYAKRANDPHYVYYRHLTYILPLLVVIVIHGWLQSGVWKKYMLTGWLLFCGAMSVRYFAGSGKAMQTYKAAGWILAQKYHAPNLFSFQNAAPSRYRSEVVQGFGWGLTAKMLCVSRPNPATAWMQTLRQTPPALRTDMLTGARYAFNKGVTPVLNPGFLKLIDSSLFIKLP